LFPEDFRNRRKLSYRNFLRKREQYPQENFLREFPQEMRTISAGNLLGRVAEVPLPVNNSSGNSPAKLFRQENSQVHN